VDVPKQFELAEEDDECHDPCLDEKLDDAWDELCLDQFMNTLSQANGTTAGGGTNNNASGGTSNSPAAGNTSNS